MGSYRRSYHPPAAGTGQVSRDAAKTENNVALYDVDDAEMVESILAREDATSAAARVSFPKVRREIIVPPKRAI
jgi:hypothetical protein